MIRVLVVDDSFVMRKLLTKALMDQPDIKVIATADDPYLARQKIVELQPDVVTLDIEMPRMDGLTFLAKIMHYYPMPVVIVSAVSPEGSDLAMRALELGAVDVISKPESCRSLEEIVWRLRETIRAAAQAHMQRKKPGRPRHAVLADKRLSFGQDQVLAMGASTGGTDAIARILAVLPENLPPTLIVQHMPPYITAAFARRLNQNTLLDVREARGGEYLRPGLVLLAPGDKHLILHHNSDRYMVMVKEGPLVHHQRPSVEVLFNSVAKYAGPKAVGVLLTGMGQDGAQGLLTMRQAGAYTIAQDESTSVVYGMPQAALALGGVEAVCPLGQIPMEIVKAFTSREKKFAEQENPRSGYGGSLSQ